MSTAALTFLASAAAEALSALAFFRPELGKPFLALAAAGAALLAVKSPKALLYAAIVEAVIGGHGRLFQAELFGVMLSARMVIFAVLAAAWIIHVMRGCSRILHFRHAHVSGPLILLLGAVTWGVLRGLMRGVPAGSVVDDANAFAFILLVPAAVDLVDGRRTLARAGQCFLGAVTWLSAKTLLLLFAFSHEFPFQAQLYAWQRKLFLAEITRLESGLYRVFSASHLFLIVALFAGFMVLWRMGATKRRWSWMSLVGAAFLLTLSRSFWLGALASFAFMIPVLARFRVLTNRTGTGLVLKGAAALSAAMALLVLATLFPVPKPLADGSAFAAFRDRFTDASDAAVSSRWNMLPPLVERISADPIFGSGFGAAITYASDDPRIHALYPAGVITTYAIEWQYLSLWMKAGLAGLAAIVWLWWRIGRFAWRTLQRTHGQDRLLVLALQMSFFAFVIANIFTPYVDHPLGWMFLALIIAALHTLGEHEHS